MVSMTEGCGRLTVLVAGMPRSGSTWLFNAARLLLAATGRPVHAAWVADRDPDDPAPMHLVKVHTPEEAAFPHDLVLTTRRPIDECLASLIRMGWLKPDAEAIRTNHRIQTSLYDHWAARSTLETTYDDILHRPEAAVARIAEALGLAPDAARDARLAADLAALRAPESGRYDPETLLHPRHRGSDDGTPEADTVALVRAALAEM